MRLQSYLWIVVLAVVLLGATLLDTASGFEGDAPGSDWVAPRMLEWWRYRLVDRFGQMKATLRQGDSTRPFVLKGGALAAPKGLPKWIWVGPVQADVPVDGDPIWARSVPQSGGKSETLCLWAHPLDKGVVVLEWPEAPVGTLHGLVHFLPAADAKAGVKLKVFWNGALLQTHTPATQPGKSFFYRVNLVSKSAKTGQLRLEIEARQKGRNHICVDGLVDSENWAEPKPPKEPQDEALPGSDTPRAAQSTGAQASDTGEDADDADAVSQEVTP